MRLSADLQSRFGRGFGRANLFQMRSFHLAYLDTLQTVSGLSADRTAAGSSPLHGRCPRSPTAGIQLLIDNTYNPH